MTAADPASPLAKIWRAGTADELVAALDEARTTAPVRHAEADDAARWWSALVAAAVGRAVDVVGPPDGMRWRWFVTGSCGRGEGLPGADVETLAVFESVVDGDGGGAERRPEVLARAATVHDVLERGGLAPDGNGATASRVRCCRTRDGWAAAIDRWAQSPQTDRGVVMAGLTLDALPVGGDADPLGDVAASMRAAAARHRELRGAMAQDCTSPRELVPARLAVLTGRRDSVDVKRAVVDPIVRLARFKALLAGSAASATSARLLVDDDQLADIDWPGLDRAYRSATALRWALRSSRWETMSAGRDVVVLADLAPHDRAALRSAGREVVRAQRVLRYVWRML